MQTPRSPDDVLALLRTLGAPPRLIRHHELSSRPPAPSSPVFARRSPSTSTARSSWSAPHCTTLGRSSTPSSWTSRARTTPTAASLF